MASRPDVDDDSFIIILGSSPGASMDGKCNGAAEDINTTNLEDAIKDLPDQANMAFKAQFNLTDSPSPASMMVASTLITDDRSTEELQKRFGELLDENMVLKETLKQNNDSMKEQFSLIASCQDDMLKTHKLHKEKFDETRELVEKLRLENKKLKEDIVRMSLSNGDLQNGETKSGASSTVEFVTSPDDDTINKLTAQLELVEKQRRQVILENERLTWQKESLEHITDVTSKERDELKKKLDDALLKLSSLEEIKATESKKIVNVQSDLQKQLQAAKADVAEREATIKRLESKMASLISDLKNAQLEILQLKNVKMEFAQYKSGVTEMVRMYKEQMQELNARLKDVQTVVFQPVYPANDDTEKSSEYGGLLTNVQLYNRTLKHLADHFNSLTTGLSDGLIKVLGALVTTQEVKLERASLDTLKSGLVEIKKLMEKQHTTVVANLGEVKGTLAIFEGIFKDYSEVLKKTVAKRETPPPSASVEQLTAALVARGQELQELQNELVMLAAQREDCELLKAQLDLYRSDFEAERKSREEMAGERVKVARELRLLKKQHQLIVAQLDEVRKLSPSVHRTAIAKVPARASNPLPATQTQTPKPTPTTTVNTTPTAPTTAPTTSGNMMYTCPKCRFSSNQYKVMEDHFDFCLDDF